jgi:perosamine synthetase
MPEIITPDHLSGHLSDKWREVPPTAGLPLKWRDFLPPPHAVALETTLAALLEVPSVQLECSGTAALVVTLTTLQRASARRSVVIPAYTCPLVALAVIHCGLKPVLCDLRENHFELGLQGLETACNDDTLAIIPTHLGGRAADLARVIEIARRKGAWVIEDAAQSLGAVWREQAVGTSGDVGFFSLAVGKGLTLYEGGVLVARDAGLRQALYETSLQIAPYRLAWEIRRLLELVAYGALYRPAALRFAYGIPLRRALRKGKLIEAVGDDFSAGIPLHRVGTFRRAIGANASTRLPSFLDVLAEQAKERKSALARILGLSVIDDAEGGRGTWPFLMVLMPTARACERALAQLWTAGLGVSRLFLYALPDYPYLTTQLGTSDVPNARDFAARMLTISNSPWLQEGDFQRICSVLAGVLDLTA